MDTFSHVPPGFRFHPTDEELVDFYLRKKVESRRIDLDIIKDVDLYKIEPWDLREKFKMGTDQEQNEWYFYSHKDKKYPTGTRTNRATAAGFWKATGRDKPIHSKNSLLIGMRKTLVFYKGRALNGQKSDWIMHEYRLETNENAPPQEEGWVVCRVFVKRITTNRRVTEHDSCSSWYDDHVSATMDHRPETVYYNQHHHCLLPCKPDIELHYHLPVHDSLLRLPQLESPKLPVCFGHATAVLLSSYNITQQEELMQYSNKQLQMMPACNNTIGRSTDQAVEQVTDWRVLDKLVSSQPSHDDICNNCYNSASDVHTSERYEANVGYGSASNSSEQIELWK